MAASYKYDYHSAALISNNHIAMSPIIALVGRPNVGKSTLFNALTRTRNALVADIPGLTRDRQYGIGQYGLGPYVVIDTGGLTGDHKGLNGLVECQAWRAIKESDSILLLVDGRCGLTVTDEEIAGQLRHTGKLIHLVINKAEDCNLDLVSTDFHNLGFEHVHVISAAHKQGIESLIGKVFTALGGRDNAVDIEINDPLEEVIRLAIVGRPNVGKSTLINCLLGEERMLVCDIPGITRDSISIPFAHNSQRYLLIDTAGVRRRARVNETVEKFSVIKTLQAIEQAHVAVLVLDARQGISDQDASLLGLVLERGRSLVIAVNKWDHLDISIRSQVRSDLHRRLGFLKFARVHFISALHGTNVSELLDAVCEAHTAATCKLSTSELTSILEETVATCQPPLVRGRSVKLRYAHQGGRNPPIIVIHGSRVESIPAAYRRYLVNAYRKQLHLWGTPIRIEFRSSSKINLIKKAKDQ
jgi:GTP-binding protein